MKSIIVAGLLLGSASSAIAGPYVNVESNSAWIESDYIGAATDIHVGVEGDNWYIQGGPTIVSPDGFDGEIEMSGKIGGSLPISTALSLYGEISGTTGDFNSYGMKVGAKYNF